MSSPDPSWSSFAFCDGCWSVRLVGYFNISHGPVILRRSLASAWSAWSCFLGNRCFVLVSLGEGECRTYNEQKQSQPKINWKCEWRKENWKENWFLIRLFHLYKQPGASVFGITRDCNKYWQECLISWYLTGRSWSEQEEQREKKGAEWQWEGRRKKQRWKWKMSEGVRSVEERQEGLESLGHTVHQGRDYSTEGQGWCRH